jgi:hypothetical protein
VGELSIAFVLFVMVMIAAYAPRLSLGRTNWDETDIFVGALIVGVVVSVLYLLAGAIRNCFRGTD